MKAAFLLFLLVPSIGFGAATEGLKKIDIVSPSCTVRVFIDVTGATAVEIIPSIGNEVRGTIGKGGASVYIGEPCTAINEFRRRQYIQEAKLKLRQQSEVVEDTASADISVSP